MPRMSAQSWGGNMKSDWIIFYSEKTGRIGFVPLGSKAATHTKGKALGTFRGTYYEAQDEVERREREFGIK